MTRKPHDRAAAGSPHSSSRAIWLYGLHAVRAALANPRRKLHRAVLTEAAAAAIGARLLARVRHEIAPPTGVARWVPAGAVHQGAALSCEPLASPALEDLLSEDTRDSRMIAVLDQISDPHNVGAILRSAAALGAAAVIVQDRHAPPQSGALAKSASGALDLVPYIEVVNIARCLKQLGEMGFWRVALSAEGEQTIEESAVAGDVAVVLGSEGAGIRRLVRERCDAAASIPLRRELDSLNVSAAAAIAFYELGKRLKR